MRFEIGDLLERSLRPRWRRSDRAGRTPLRRARRAGRSPRPVPHVGFHGDRAHAERSNLPDGLRRELGVAGVVHDDVAPPRASVSASARPMPRELPVISAVAFPKRTARPRLAHAALKQFPGDDGFSGSRWCPLRTVALVRRDRRVRWRFGCQKPMPPWIWSALSVTRLSISTAAASTWRTASPRRRRPPSQRRAACRTSWRAASMSVAFSATMNRIAWRCSSFLPNVSRAARRRRSPVRARAAPDRRSSSPPRCGLGTRNRRARLQALPFVAEAIRNRHGRAVEDAECA